MKQMKRVEDFLKSLEANGTLSANAQSMVLIPELSFIGGKNSGGCTNELGEDCKSGVNDRCVNGVGCGPGADNKSCVNPGTNVAGSQCSGTTINYVCTADNLDSATCKKS